MKKSTGKSGKYDAGAIEKAFAEAEKAMSPEEKMQYEEYKRKFTSLSKRVRSDEEATSTDKIQQSMLQTTLAMILELIPVAEKIYRIKKSENAAYALNALINQSREIVVDLKLAKDVTGQVTYIRNEVLTPVFIAFTQTLIDSVYELNRHIDSNVTKTKEAIRVKEQVTELAKTLGRFQTGMINQVTDNITAYLSGNLVTTQEPKRVKKTTMRKKRDG